MSTLSRQTTWATADTLTASDLNAEFDNIINDYNGGITNANISASAAIAATKLQSTVVTTTSTHTLTNKTLTSPTINTPTISQGTLTKSKLIQPYTDIQTATDGATVTFDLSAGQIQQVTLGGNRTLAISNEQAGQVFVLRLIQDGTGSRTVTWFSTIKWAGGSAPTLTTTAAKTDVLGFICTAADTYDGFVVGQDL